MLPGISHYPTAHQMHLSVLSEPLNSQGTITWKSLLSAVAPGTADVHLLVLPGLSHYPTALREGDRTEEALATENERGVPIYAPAQVQPTQRLAAGACLQLTPSPL